MTLRWVPGWNGLTEPEAVSYVAAVEAADGQELEFGVAKAINDFVLGCKNDGIWDAIKASCILAGARTLNGALVPLAGTAPTNYNFAAGDYNRKTGLVGDGSTKYLDSNRNNNADPQNNQHLSCFITTYTPGSISALTGAGVFADFGNSYLLRGSSIGAKSQMGVSVAFLGANIDPIGLFAASRNNNLNFSCRLNGVNNLASFASVTPLFNSNILVFSRGTAAVPDQPTDARIAFYSIGESLDLAALDTRVSTLITAIGAAIP